MARILQSVGPWEILRPLGRGGMGAVFLARLRAGGPPVALKLFSSWEENGPEVQRFHREYEILHRLRHPGIVSVAGGDSAVGYDPKHRAHWIAMMWIDGPTLESRLDAGPLPHGYAANVFYTLTDALDYAHRRGVFHRDVKPANILLGADGARFVDFGVALHTERTRLTIDGTQPGTLAYMAPEIFDASAGEPKPALMDIYALGVTLYEALLARRAFAEDPSLSDRARQARVLKAKMNAEPLDPGRRVPEALRAAVRAMTEPDPGRRLASWSGLRDLLAQVPTDNDLSSDARYEVPPAPTESPTPAVRGSGGSPHRSDNEPTNFPTAPTLLPAAGPHLSALVEQEAELPTSEPHAGALTSATHGAGSSVGRMLLAIGASAASVLIVSGMSWALLRHNDTTDVQGSHEGAAPIVPVEPTLPIPHAEVNGAAPEASGVNLSPEAPRSVSGPSPVRPGETEVPRPSTRSTNAQADQPPASGPTSGPPVQPDADQKLRDENPEHVPQSSGIPDKGGGSTTGDGSAVPEGSKPVPPEGARSSPSPSTAPSSPLTTDGARGLLRVYWSGGSTGSVWACNSTSNCKPITGASINLRPGQWTIQMQGATPIPIEIRPNQSLSIKCNVIQGTCVEI